MKFLALFRLFLAVASLFFSTYIQAGNITVNSGGTLNGGGNVDANILINNGAIAPGLGPGCLSVNNLDYSAGGTLAIEIGGDTACSGYDQLQVIGSVSLGATLSATAYSAYLLNGGEVYTIIDNDGADAVLGTFAGLTEGSLVSIGSKNASISYVGGDGNDVVLTALSEQTISFAAIADQTYDVSTINLAASSSSGLAVTYASATASVCTVSGSTVSFVTTGLCSITASQSGNNFFNSAADVTQNFLINEAFQSINFPAIADKTYGDAIFTVNATASSGLTIDFTSSSTPVCTVSGSTVTIVSPGTCIITASQPGDMNYAIAADITQTFEVNKASQTITFNALSDKSYGDVNFSVSATAGSGLAVSFASTTTSVCTLSGSTVAMINVGVCTITASQSGNTYYQAAIDNAQSFNVLDATPPVITLNGSANVTVTKGGSYTDAGATALDDIDGDISGSIVVSGTVETSNIGVQNLNFDVSDAAGNAAITLIRSVTVEDTDADGDGIGDSTDPDDDNDGVNDTDDAFPFDPTETTDTDGDGIGNNADTDDDNDGILDDDDSDPLTPNVVDTESPVIGDVEDVTFEATGEFTTIELSTPEVSDNITLSPTILSDLTGALTLGEHVVTWIATDTAGNQSTKEQLVTIVDTTAPEFDAIHDITVEATGVTTDITPLINVIATDLVDGELSAEFVGNHLLVSGRHEVTWRVKDLSGNSATAQMNVDILPEISIDSAINVEAGTVYYIEVMLSGEAPRYPVNFSYQLMLNTDIIEQSTTLIEKGVQSRIQVSVPTDALVTDRLNLTIEDVDNAYIGSHQKLQLKVIEKNLSPQLKVTVSQQENNSQIIDPENGLVTLTANITDMNTLDVHDVNWQVSDNAIADQQLDNNPASFEFEPSFLDEGIYHISITASENNTAEQFSVSRTVQLVLEQLAPLSDTRDSDGDGIVDSVEGYGDDDGDGIANYLDKDAVTSRLPVGAGQAPLQTSSEYNLSVGSLVRALQGAKVEFASLSLAELIQLADDYDASAELPGYQLISPIYNFVIEGLIQSGDSAVVTIQLNDALPQGAVYRKYNPRDGWYDFLENHTNTISSAPLLANGQCPEVNDISYSQGLIAGEHCVQLMLEDGGTNDFDFTANGVIEDPGAFMVEQQNQAPEIDLPSYYEVNEQSEIVLDASNSFDADGDSLAFSWQQISGIELALLEVSSSQLIITVPEVHANETVNFELTVSDGQNNSIATTQLLILQVNKAPEVTISNHQSVVAADSLLSLSAEGNDADGDALNYTWQQLSGPDISFDYTTSATVNISLPEVITDSVVELQVTVSDGKLSTIAKTSFIIESQLAEPSENSNSRGGGSVYWLLMFLLLVNVQRNLLKRF